MTMNIVMSLFVEALPPPDASIFLKSTQQACHPHPLQAAGSDRPRGKLLRPDICVLPLQEGKEVRAPHPPSLSVSRRSHWHVKKVWALSLLHKAPGRTQRSFVPRWAGKPFDYLKNSHECHGQEPDPAFKICTKTNVLKER